MGYERDQILKFWDDAIARVAQKTDDPTDEELAAAMAQVSAKGPGLTLSDVCDALRSSVEEEQRKVAAADRTLQILKGMLHNLSDKPLPGLPGGSSLKH